MLIKHLKLNKKKMCTNFFFIEKLKDDRNKKIKRDFKGGMISLNKDNYYFIVVTAVRRHETLLILRSDRILTAVRE